MKNITIDFYGKEADYVLLEDIDDVLLYGDLLSEDVRTAARRMIKTNLAPNQFDHLACNDGPGGVIRSAYFKAGMQGGSVIFEAANIADEKMRRLISHSLEGQQIMVNSVGGYCFLTENTKILREAPYKAVIPITHVIKENTRYINLENDAELEEHTIKHLRKIDRNYSHICNLRNFPQEELIKIFKKFKANGGESAYLYTTGFDIAQIHEYCNALKAAGITKVDFEFNSGISSDLQESLDIIAENMDITIKEV